MRVVVVFGVFFGQSGKLLVDFVDQFSFLFSKLKL